MFRQDKAYIGVIVGLIFPFMAFVVFYELKSLLLENDLIPSGSFSLKFLSIISLIGNVIPAGAYLRSKKDEALKGIAGITLLIAFGIIAYFYKDFIGS